MVNNFSQPNNNNLSESESIEIIKCVHTLSGHSKGLLSIVISPDGRTLVSSSEDSIKLWDIESGELKNTRSELSDKVLSVFISPDGNTLVSGSREGAIKFWNIHTGEVDRTLVLNTPDRIQRLLFSPDGQTIATYSNTGSDERIKIWNANTGQLKSSISNNSLCPCMTFSPTSKIFAYSLDETLNFLNIETGNIKTIKYFHLYNGKPCQIISIAYSPDERILATGSRANIIELADLQTPNKTKELTWDKTYDHHVDLIRFSPDGQTLAANHSEPYIRLWDVKTGILKKTLQGHSRRVVAITFSADGQVMASGSEDNTIKLWKIEKLIQTDRTSDKFNKLEILLANQQWEDADKETEELIKIIIGVENLKEKSYLTEENIQAFPCEYFNKIDRLWVQYSNGHYGFSIQKELWERVLRKEGNWSIVNCRPVSEEDELEIRIGWTKVDFHRGDYHGANDEFLAYDWKLDNKGYFPRAVYRCIVPNNRSTKKFNIVSNKVNLCN